jgi:hypothetical protein
LNQLFQAGFFNLVGHGILHPRPERPPFQQPQNFPSIPIPPHVSMQPKPPANDSSQEIVNQSVSHCHGWPTVSLTLLSPPHPSNPSVQITHVVSPVQSLHAARD